jgi:hypothetical protein
MLIGKHGGAVMAYVVRVTHAEDGDRYKVFNALPAAMEMFRAADAAVPETRSAAYLYEVPGQYDPRSALGAVKTGKAVLLCRDQHADWTKATPNEHLLTRATVRAGETE